MSNLYSNLPSQGNQASSTLRAFDLYSSAPLEFDSTIYAACKGFFTNRGFHETSAESITVIILKQSKQDNLNPLKILDTLKGLDNLELSNLVTELLNYNRFKSSNLGVVQNLRTNTEIAKSLEYYNGIYNPRTPKFGQGWIIETKDTDVYEGDKIQFRVSTVNVPNGAAFYYSIEGPNVAEGDFVLDSSTGGPFFINSGTSEFYVYPKEDYLTEGLEFAWIRLHPNLTSLTTILTATNFFITDSSKTRLNVPVQWNLSSSGLVTGYNGGWELSNNGQTLVYNIQDSLNCGGINNQTQRGIATATIFLSTTINYYVSFKLSGIGEAEEENYERMDVYLNGKVITTGRSRGGGKLCDTNIPVKITTWEPGPFILYSGTTNVIFVDFSTGDGLFHSNAFYRLDLIFEEFEL